jgi:hypothetical protein
LIEQLHALFAHEFDRAAAAIENTRAPIDLVLLAIQDRPVDNDFFPHYRKIVPTFLHGRMGTL